MSFTFDIVHEFLVFFGLLDQNSWLVLIRFSKYSCRRSIAKPLYSWECILWYNLYLGSEKMAKNLDPQKASTTSWLRYLITKLLYFVRWKHQRCRSKMQKLFLKSNLSWNLQKFKSALPGKTSFPRNFFALCIIKIGLNQPKPYSWKQKRPQKFDQKFSQKLWHVHQRFLAQNWWQMVQITGRNAVKL